MCIFSCFWDDFILSGLMFFFIMLNVLFSYFASWGKWLRSIFFVASIVYYVGSIVSAKPVELKIFIIIQVVVIFISLFVVKYHAEWEK